MCCNSSNSGVCLQCSANVLQMCCKYAVHPRSKKMVPNLPLVVKFDIGLAEILGVKETAYIPKLSRFLLA